MPIAENVVEKIIEYLNKPLEPYLIILFGSCVKGNSRLDSDIDIGFLSDKEVIANDIFAIAQELARLLGKEVDLVDLKKASTVMKAQIVSTGNVIYCGDALRRAEFEIRVLKEYALLNEERADILQNIKKRGSVYGK